MNQAQDNTSVQKATSVDWMKFTKAKMTEKILEQQREIWNLEIRVAELDESNHHIYNDLQRVLRTFENMSEALTSARGPQTTNAVRK